MRFALPRFKGSRCVKEKYFSGPPNQPEFPVPPSKFLTHPALSFFSDDCSCCNSEVPSPLCFAEAFFVPFLFPFFEASLEIFND
jgi:hypothetical protein